MNCKPLVILHSTGQLATQQDTIAEAGAVADDVDVNVVIKYQPTNGCHKKNHSFG